MLDYKNLVFLKDGYELLQATSADAEIGIPVNKGKTSDLLQRDLDCAVIEALHNSLRKEMLPEFDSVRGVFWEGKEIYPTAGFREKNHIQICVRNLDCIKGYFLPLPRITS
ncbi:hypothetical protein [Hymenobacter psoromatis]|uniref:hypothetical protein n=1 Tax=Hymenobacter psoromatis TaxID=1484116 RepID=UPI001CBE0469|nr:hypothetical protein [Hymenobacter psoromatis]